MPTGLVIDGAELVLILETPSQLDVEPIWRNVQSGVISREPPRADLGSVTGSVAPAGPGRFRVLAQMDLHDGRVVEYGDIQAKVDRITVADKGQTTEAAFTMSTYDASVVLFWLVRHGPPMPMNSQIDVGRSVPLAPELYPLVTAYDNGAVVTSARLRPAGTAQK